MLSDLKNIPFERLLRSFIIVFLNVMVFEIVIGGGGRFFEIGPLTVRMLFYLFAIPFSFVYISLSKTVDRYVIYLTLVFTVLLIIGIVLGIINSSPPDLIMEDVKPLLFFYVLPFLSVAIKHKADLIRISNVIKWSSIFLALLYIMVIIMIVTQVINFAWFYATMERFGEVMFRNETFFFYKGFLYLCVGFFFTLQPGKYNKIFSLILLIAIILTLTRGFILMVFAVTLIYFVFIFKNKALSIVIVITALLAFVIAMPFYLNSVGDRADSDIIRVIQFDQVMDKANLFNVLIGDGFGKGIPIRPVHMEISYLEIFSKQGLLGILFWLALFVYITYKCFNNPNYKTHTAIMTPFYLSVVFVYLQSMTNPFLNNSIGMSIVLISLTVFHLKEFK
jgi:O-antigen ligase